MYHLSFRKNSANSSLEDLIEIIFNDSLKQIQQLDFTSD